MNVRTFCISLVSAALFSFTLSGLAQQQIQVLQHHVPAAISSGQAAMTGSLPPTQLLNLSIVLPLRNRSELTSLLNRLYDPSSPDYRHFLSINQFTEQFGPTAQDYQAVVNFAQANGFIVTRRPANRMIVPITGSVAQIERAFNVRMNTYRHPSEDRNFFSSDHEPSLNLSVPVAHIAGLDNYSIPRPMVIKPSMAQGLTRAQVLGSGPGGSYLASDMRAAYYGGTALTGSGQTVGLVEFDGYNLSDVNLTFSNAGQSYSVPIKNVLLDGATGASASGNDSEEVLDIVQAIGMAPGLSQVRVYIGNSDTDILNEMASENVAQQVSISWTWTPVDPYSDDFAFQEMAAQGQSVFAASGDAGEFDPLIDNFYPAEDDWVTTVGGTDLVTNGAGHSWNSETAWTYSGGGISPDGISIPSWQAGVASASNGGSTTLRNVPDVAMEANTDNYNCNMGVCSGGWGGTSFAAPRWAGFMALVNQQAVATGNSTVGFINPAIYSIGAGSSYNNDFHDVTSGNNSTEGGCCGQAFFYAVPGYDLVTGWGSPTGQGLIDALAPPVSEGFHLAASSTSLIVKPGASVSTAITVNFLNGFNSGVNLTVSGLPNGVTGSFAPNSTSSSSVLTLTASNSAIRGSYLVTITGTSGAVTATTTVAVQVDAPGFSIAPSFATMLLNPGVSGANTITVTDYAGFTGNVSLAVTAGLPNGVTASWFTNPTTGSSVLTLTADNSAISNTRTMVTITGTSGALTATTTIALTVDEPLFFLNISPVPFSIVQNGSATATVTVVPQGNFTSGVTLTAPQLPAGVTATFSPNPTTGSSVMTMTASGSAPLGTSAVQVTGSVANCCTSMSSFAQTVTSAPTPTFLLGVSPAALTLVQGQSVTDTVTVTPKNGFTGSVSLAVAYGLPSGVTASWSTNPTSGTSLLTLTASSTATVGSGYIVGISGTAGYSVPVLLFLTVKPAPGFTLGTSAAFLTMTQGQSVTDTITVAPQPGFTGNVTLSAPSLPSGLTGSFNPNPTTGASVLTLTTNSSISPGNYFVTVTGTSGIQSVTTVIALRVVGSIPTTTALSINPSGGALNPGSNYTLTATVTPSIGSVVPTGNVIFTIGTATQVVALNSAGVATYTGTAPASGTLTLSAAYQGSSAFSASTSNTLTEAIVASPATTLAVISSGTPVTSVAEKSVVTLTATVRAGAVPITTGQVNFCDATATYCTDIHLLGTAQLTATGTAVLKFVPAPGSHSYEAVFLGTAANSTGSSTVAPLTVSGSGNTTTTTIAQSGSRGNYTLTATVTGMLADPPTGTVSFLDTSNANYVLGTAELSRGTGGSGLTFFNSSSPATKPNPQSVAVGDFNGDGKLDLVVPVGTAPGISILLGNGNGTFTAGQTAPAVGSDVSSTVVADFNSDGKADLALSVPGTGTVVLLGNGNGTFNAMPAMPGGGWQVATGDFNGDGRADLVALNCTLTILLGNGDGTFRPASSPAPTSGCAQAAAVGDFNGDGKADIAVLNESSGQDATGSVTILLGHGDGSFSPVVQSLVTGGSPMSIVAGDFRGNGILDLAVANARIGSGAPGTVSVFLGNGDGTFTSSGVSPQVGLMPYSVAMGDFNGDGKVDLVTANVGSNTASVLLGNGDGTFTPAAAPAAGKGPIFASVGDFSGYGLSDIAVADNGSSQVTILLSQMKGTATVTGVAPAGTGTHLVDASYPGDGNYSGSVSATTGVTAGPPQIPTTTALSISPSGGTLKAGSSYTLTATVMPSSGSAVPTGNVIFTIGTATQTIALNSAGVATYMGTAPMAAGQLKLAAAYQGTSAFAPSTSNTLNETVFVPTTAALSISPSAGIFYTAQSVTVTDSTPGAVIYYTTNGTAPTTNSTIYSGPIAIGQTTTLRAFAAATGYNNSAAASVTYTLKATTPTFSLAPGTYSTPQTVNITDATPNAAIWYTTDGTTPVPGQGTAVQFLSGNPVHINQTTVLKAVAAVTGWTASSAALQTYTLKVTTPIFSLAPGTYSTPQTVNITDATPNAAIWYTTDGTTPVPGQGTALHFLSGTPVQINQTTVLKAVAAVTGWTTSSAGFQTYTFKVATPTFSLVPGTYSTPQTVNITDATPNAAIWYTTDGTAPIPGQGSAVQFLSGNPVHISQTTVLKAVAAVTGWTTSSAALQTYTLKVTTPTFSLAPGTYSTPQTVNITDATPNAAIWYTTDGTTPVPGQGTAVQLLSGNQVHINQTTVLKAVAAATGWITSSAGSVTYTLKVATPTFSLAPGTYSTPQTVNIFDTTPNAAIWYTIDGSTPVPGQGTSVQFLSGIPVQINQTKVLKAVATETGWTSSGVIAAAYTIH